VTQPLPKTHLRAALAILLSVALPGCNALDRLSKVGEEPQLTTIQNPSVTMQGALPVSLPMPAPLPVERQPNSLWRPGSRAFLKDQRASQVGDILTVLIQIDDSASLNNSSSRSRSSGENASANALLGYEASLGAILPEAINPANLIEFGSEGSSAGEGATGSSR